ncbi:MAG TPA: zf-TFIIB domain-containing protein [Planctomycetota bacterium]|nr:zf-TFIIB domain-containing protein [Planctomycetota bacterium]
MCPACKEPLITFELDGVEIDRCLRCSGTWLDDGEFDQIARLEGAKGDPLGKAVADAADGVASERRCVRCNSRMKLATVQSVEIDRCPRGHGIWFDRNEMESLIAAFKDAGTARLLGELHSAKPKKGG